MMTPDKKPKLLVVDDEIEHCSLIKDYFSDKYEVCVAYDGVDAVNKVGEFAPDCVLMDIKMPKMDGITALELIKTSHAKIPVIMVSASGSVRAATESVKKGADDYILKPVDLQELENKIEIALRKAKVIK